MSREAGAIYNGTVVHARLRPVTHRLRYGVFSVLVDCARLEELDRGTRLFSVNRPNLLSLYEKDHGDRGALLPYLMRVAGNAGLAGRVERFLMLAYPRILGYAFNPLTVYYGLDARGRVALLIYEVHNTFGEELSYVIPAQADLPDGDVINQSCDKRFYVSPFNRVEGRYRFRVTEPGEDLSVAVTLENEGETVLTASFAGKRAPLTDRQILKALARTGWMTARVTLGIHIEALKLWVKGLRLTRRPRIARQSVIYHDNPDSH